MGERMAEQENMVDDCKEAMYAKLYQTELDRIKFVLNSYQRVRLQKIENSVVYILQNPNMTNRLSAAERKYAAGYMKLWQDHCTRSFLHSISDQYNKLDDEDMINTPNMDAFVFAKVKEDVGIARIG